MKLLIVMFALMAVILAAPQGFGGKLRGQEGYGGTNRQFLGQNEILKESSRVKSRGVIVGQKVYVAPWPNVNAQSETYNYRNPDGFGVQGKYGRPGPKVVVHSEGGHLSFNNMGGYGSQGVYGVPGPYVVVQSARFNLGNLGGAGPQYVGKGQRLNSGRLGLDNIGAYGVPGSYVGGESERFKGFSNGEGVDGHGTQTGLQWNNRPTYFFKCAICSSSNPFGK
nr:uncharacterized protein LOC118877095 [Drosophila suzukii]XP_036669936.1 uncharacterized protein LOC118877095 [Drosophila suzukii]